MRKIILTAAVALPLAGIAAYAFAATSGSVADQTQDRGLTASASELASADQPIVGKAVHKRLSIKGVFGDDDQGRETEGGEGMDAE